jgi:hypothetical protein
MFEKRNNENNVQKIIQPTECVIDINWKQIPAELFKYVAGNFKTSDYKSTQKSRIDVVPRMKL